MFRQKQQSWRGLHLLHRIDLLEIWITEKAEASNAKHCVEHIHHISRSVCQPTQFRILQLSVTT